LATDGRSGLELAREVRPDLVITDLMMPVMDGFAVVEAIKADPALAHVPIIVVSAKDLSSREREYLQANTDMILQKGSFIDDELMERLLERLD
jgi:CheY-like chemotaxis protein